MTKKNSPPESAPKSTRVKWEFVRYELDEAQIKQCREWVLDWETLDDLLLKLHEYEYKFVLKWDAYNSCYQAMMSTDNKFQPNYNLGLVGRGSTPLKALKQVLFKHAACGEVWPAPDFHAGRSVEFND